IPPSSATMVGRAGATRVRFNEAMSDPSIKPAKTARTARSTPFFSGEAVASRAAEQHTPAVGGVLVAFDISGPDEPVREHARRGHGDAEQLGQPPDRRHLFIAKEVDRSQLLHRDVEIAPATGSRGQERSVDLLVGNKRFID